MLNKIPMQIGSGTNEPSAKSDSILARLTALCSWKKNVEVDNPILHFGHKHNGKLFHLPFEIRVR